MLRHAVPNHNLDSVAARHDRGCREVADRHNLICRAYQWVSRSSKSRLLGAGGIVEFYVCANLCPLDGHPWHKTFGLHVGLCVERLNRARNYSRQRRHTSDKGQKIIVWLWVLCSSFGQNKITPLGETVPFCTLPLLAPTQASIIKMNFHKRW